MKINPDYVPGNLEEAVKILKEGLTPDDIKEIKNPLFDALKVHFTVGMMLRNEWSLWEKDTILVKWFKKISALTMPTTSVDLFSIVS